MTEHTKLSDRVAIVSGGAKGIGAAISRHLAEAGAHVVIIDLDETAATAYGAALPNAGGVGGDVADYAAMDQIVTRTVTEHGHVDILINNAGWDHVQPFTDNDPALWDALVDVNLKGVFNLTHAALPRMRERNFGRIVNIASDAGRVGSMGEAAYSACKGGTISFTKSIAREAARNGIAVNCVCPGPTETPLLAQITQDERAASIMSAIVKATPTRRATHPDEVAQAAAFFASCPNQITGQVLSVSGGLTMAG
ncbi:SDR family oxidoreductase [Actinomadura madurae]|uniref:SDR family NAD(P)-dependent oxidoreductase n=1 Tax=Actinomadura madurae TaxID=1993 RepID=UPI00399C3E62